MTMPAPRHGVPRIVARPDARPMREEVLRGLQSEPKTLPPKLFYDETGAALFEQICELPEYYLTRAELEILRARSGEIAELAGPRVALLEYGSGAGVKIRLLLDALESPAAYVPIDISREQLGRVARELAAEYPGVAIRPLNADYTLAARGAAAAGRIAQSRVLSRLDHRQLSSDGGRRSSSAACAARSARMARWCSASTAARARRRSTRRTTTAAGVTAAVQPQHPRAPQSRPATRTSICARSSIARSSTRARAASRCISVSTVEQIVKVAGEPIHFEKGESIWTESSYKYDRARLEELIETAGFRMRKLWTNRKRQFWVAYLEAV